MIRLFRIGKKKQPSYKVVVTDKRNAPARGRFVEEVGTYNPLTKEAAFNKERIAYWLKTGAQASDTVHNLLIQNKVIEGEKRKMAFKKKAEEVKPEEKPAETPVAEEKPVETEQPVIEEKPAEEALKEEPVVEEKPAEETPAQS